MMLPIKRILLPPKSALMTKVVSAGMKTIVQPLMTPGKESGKTMRRKVCQWPAPRSCAASMMLLSMCESET